MTALLRYIKKSREQFHDRHYHASDFHNKMYSGGTFSTWKETRKILKQYCSGLTLDAGSGGGAWHATILKFTNEYESIEIAPRGDHVPTWLGDITNMSAIPSERYDTVFCQQVLKHVPQPFEAVREINRVLKPGGKLIMTVPHLSKRHELPHDYYRYTQNGLRYIFENSEFDVAYIAGYGGIIPFLHHQASFIFTEPCNGVLDGSDTRYSGKHAVFTFNGIS